MASSLIIIVGILYLITGLDFLIKGNYPMFIIFTSYSLSNVGLYLASKG